MNALTAVYILPGTMFLTRHVLLDTAHNVFRSNRDMTGVSPIVQYIYNKRFSASRNALRPRCRKGLTPSSTGVPERDQGTGELPGRVLQAHPATKSLLGLGLRLPLMYQAPSSFLSSYLALELAHFMTIWREERTEMRCQIWPAMDSQLGSCDEPLKMQLGQGF